MVAQPYTVTPTGVGKRDYSRDVSLGQIRPGISLNFNQQLVQFGYTPQDIVVTPYMIPWVRPTLPGIGTHTAAINPTVMTDAVATFIVNQLVGLVIFNITDHSYGTVIANTANTVTVAALTGGITNRWNPGDVYCFGSHIYDLDTGIPTPYTVPAGYTITVIEKSLDFSEDSDIILFVDGMLVAFPAVASSGSVIDISQIVGYSTTIFDPLALLPHIVDEITINRGTGLMHGGCQIVTILEKIGSPPWPDTKDTMCPFCRIINNVPIHTTTIVCKNCGATYKVADTTLKRKS